MTLIQIVNMNERIKELAEQAEKYALDKANKGNDEDYDSNKSWIYYYSFDDDFKEKFAELIVRECINKIETHQIPVGNSAAGEMACEMTYSALMEIRDEIKEHFGVGLQSYKVICDRTNNP